MAPMGTGERQLTDQGRERKQQILDAAAALFAERGYAQTRIADICEAAGVAKGLYYWYFENKESLFAELVRSMRQQLRRIQAGAMADGGDPIDRLCRATEASVRFLAEHRAYFAFVEGEQDEVIISDVLRESSQLYVADAEKVLREAQSIGAIPDDHDPALLAFGVLGAVAHFTQFHRSGHLDLPVDELAEFVSGWIRRALGAS
jgi:AcrR family transcriptional regulator